VGWVEEEEEEEERETERFQANYRHESNLYT